MITRVVIFVHQLYFNYLNKSINSIIFANNTKSLQDGNAEP